MAMPAQPTEWTVEMVRALPNDGNRYEVIGGETFAASFRRHFALVVFHPVLDGARLVEIYDCQSATPRRTVRSVTLQTGE